MFVWYNQGMARRKGTPKSGEVIPFGGKWQTIKQIADQAGMPATTLRSRIQTSDRKSLALAAHEAAIKPLVRRPRASKRKAFSVHLARKFDQLIRAR